MVSEQYRDRSNAGIGAMECQRMLELGEPDCQSLENQNVGAGRTMILELEGP